MTEEQATKLVELLESYNKAVDLSTWFLAGAILFGLAIIGWELYRLIKVRKWLNEYKSTLNEEQRKAINDYKEISK